MLPPRKTAHGCAHRRTPTKEGRSPERPCQTRRTADNEPSYFLAPPWRSPMRSQFLVPAAIAAVGACFWFTSTAQARPPADSATSGTKKAAELHADEKSMKKQLQWEDKVMGPDDKRDELAKIARAHAINEKAEKEKERQAALESSAPAPRVAPASKKNEKAEVAIPSTAAPEKNERDANRPHDISPKLATEAAQAAPPPAKPA